MDRRIISASLALIMMMPLSSCVETQPAQQEYVQPADGEKLSDEAILNMFEVNGTRLSFPTALSSLTSIEGVSARRIYNIDYPDDVDITVYLYCEGKMFALALHDKDGNISDITFVDSGEDGIVKVNGLKLSDHYSLEKLMLPMLDKEGQYKSGDITLKYQSNVISLSLGDRERKSYTGDVTTDMGSLPASWDSERLLSSLSINGTAVTLPCKESDITKISGIKLERDISETDPSMVGITAGGEAIGYFKENGDNVYCITVTSKGDTAIDGKKLEDTEECEKLVSEIYGMNVSDYVTSFKRFSGDTPIGMVYTYEPGNTSISLEILDK